MQTAALSTLPRPHLQLQQALRAAIFVVTLFAAGATILFFDGPALAALALAGIAGVLALPSGGRKAHAAPWIGLILLVAFAAVVKFALVNHQRMHVTARLTPTSGISGVIPIVAQGGVHGWLQARGDNTPVHPLIWPSSSADPVR